MSSSHIKTAHDFGVSQALSQFGYASVDDLIKEAQSVGLVDREKVADEEEGNHPGLGALLGGGLGGLGGALLSARLLHDPFMPNVSKNIGHILGGLVGGTAGSIAGSGIGASDDHRGRAMAGAGLGALASVPFMPRAVEFISRLHPRPTSLSQFGSGMRGSLLGAAAVPALGAALGAGILGNTGKSED